MKLKITDVMICEWDTETKCMIVSPAEGWKVNVNYPISEAHASLVTMEKMDGDYSHLIGKWVKAIGADIDCVRTGKWYQALREIDGGLVVSDENGDNNYVWEIPASSFDLTVARDYNPDERKPHQLKEYDAVECTPEERAEIIRVADECGVPVYDESRTRKNLFPNLSWSTAGIVGLFNINKCRIEWKWHTVPDFIAKIRGEYTAVNVSEHKHPQL